MTEEIPEIKPKANETAKVLKNTFKAEEAKLAMPEPEAPKKVKIEVSEEELNDLRQIIAERKMGGRSEAGFIAKQPNAEEERRRRANEYLKSTGLKI